MTKEMHYGQSLKIAVELSHPAVSGRLEVSFDNESLLCLSYADDLLQKLSNPEVLGRLSQGLSQSLAESLNKADLELLQAHQDCQLQENEKLKGCL